MAVVIHNDGVTASRLAGVEMFVWDGSRAHFGFTNARGVLRLQDMRPGANYFAAVGPSVDSPRCTNADFRNPIPGPDFGKQMLSVFWKGHQGERSFDTFRVRRNQVTRLRFTTRTPQNQNRVCGGMKVTIFGTRGSDDGNTMIRGTGGTDVINALGGNDRVVGLGGSDSICGGPGEDRLFGNDGDDFLWGEADRDLLVGGDGTDFLHGGFRRDTRGDTCRTGETLIDCER